MVRVLEKFRAAAAVTALPGRTVGAGANYQASGYYRSEMQCVMFNRIDHYCNVCQDAIATIIDFCSRPAGAR